MVGLFSSAFQGRAPVSDTREDGVPLQPNSFTHNWDRNIANIDLPRIRFHDLRHARATHMLAREFIPKWQANGSAKAGFASRSTFIRMFCRICRPMPRQSLTTPYVLP
jgi:integrase